MSVISIEEVREEKKLQEREKALRDLDRQFGFLDDDYIDRVDKRLKEELADFIEVSV